MTWHTVVAALDELPVVLRTIRSEGGTITSSCPCSAGCLVTYVTGGG